MDEIEREVLVLVGGESVAGCFGDYYGYKQLVLVLLASCVDCCWLDMVVAGTDGCFELLEAELISAEDRILVVLTVVGSEARTDCKRWQVLVIL